MKEQAFLIYSELTMDPQFISGTKLINSLSQAVGAHIFNSSIQEDLWELLASLVYSVSFRTGKAVIQRNCLEKLKTK